MSCLKCGKCCEAIVLFNGAKTLHRNKSSDARFIMKYWKPISIKKARRVNPMLANKIQKARDEGTLDGKRFFECRKLNHKTKECRVHNHKPDVCKNYPYYGEKPNSERLLFKGCGFSQMEVKT